MPSATAVFSCRRYSVMSEESSSISSSHDDDSITAPSSSQFVDELTEQQSWSLQQALNAIRKAASNLQTDQFALESECTDKLMDEQLTLAEYLAYAHNDTQEFKGQLFPSSAPAPTFIEKVAKWIASNDIEYIEVEVEPYEYAEYFEYNNGGKKKFRCGPPCSLL